MSSDNFIARRLRRIPNPFPLIIVGLIGFFIYSFCYRLAWRHIGGGRGIALICVFSLLLTLIIFCWTIVIAIGPGYVPIVKPGWNFEEDRNTIVAKDEIDTSKKEDVMAGDSLEGVLEAGLPNSSNQFHSEQDIQQTTHQHLHRHDPPDSVLTAATTTTTPLIFLCDPSGYPLWCSHCQTIKMDRSHHSSQLNRCIPRMDHFCGLIYAVIGERNNRWFIQLVFYFWAIILFVLICMLIFINNGPLSRNGIFIAMYAICAGWIIMLTTFILTHINYILCDYTTLEKMSFRGGTFPIYNIECNGQRIVTRLYPEDINRYGPYSQGLWTNWKALMGPTIAHWFLPFVPLPKSSYGTSRYGKPPNFNKALYETLKLRYLSGKEGYLAAQQPYQSSTLPQQPS